MGQSSWEKFSRLGFILFVMETSWLPAKLLFAQACTVTFDNAASTTANAQSATLSLTVGGLNRLLVVQVDVEGNDGASSITGVSYAGAPMSQVLQTVRSGGSGGRQATFVLTSPALGTNNVIVTLAGGKSMEIGASDYNGVDQTTPTGAATFVQNPLSLSQSIPITTTTSNSWIILNLLAYSNLLTITLGAGQTQRWSKAQTDTGEGDDEVAPSPGLYIPSYQLSSSLLADIHAIEIRPCPGITPTATPTPSMTGTSSPTATPSFTLTNTPTITLTNTTVNTPTYTPTLSPTDTPTLRPTSTPTPTPSFPTPTFTSTPFSVTGVSPNPFTPNLPTNNLAYFNVPTSHGAGELLIVDLHRRTVRTLSFGVGVAPAWDGRDNSGRTLPGGLYLYLLAVDGHTRRGSIAILR